MATISTLEKEKAYLQKHQAELTDRYPGKYVVIQGEERLGAYDTYEQGVDAGVLHLGAGPFLVRSVFDTEDEEFIIPALAMGVPLNADS